MFAGIKTNQVWLKSDMGGFKKNRPEPSFVLTCVDQTTCMEHLSISANGRMWVVLFFNQKINNMLCQIHQLQCNKLWCNPSSVFPVPAFCQWLCQAL
jgi:hypothetical protein